MIGCKMISPDGTFQPSSARRFRTLLSILLSESGIIWRFRKFFPPDENSIREIDLPQESGMIIRREVLDQVGLLDEQFFMFGEGADWCRRIKHDGWKIMFLPDCHIIHFGGTTNQKASLKMFIQSYKSTYLYFRKKNVLISQCYRLLILIIYAIKFLFAKTHCLLNKSKENSLSDLLSYYQALINFMLTGISNPNCPYPVD